MTKNRFFHKKKIILFKWNESNIWTRFIFSSNSLECDFYEPYTQKKKKNQNCYNLYIYRFLKPNMDETLRGRKREHRERKKERWKESTGKSEVQMEQNRERERNHVSNGCSCISEHLRICIDFQRERFSVRVCMQVCVWGEKMDFLTVFHNTANVQCAIVTHKNFFRV